MARANVPKFGNWESEDNMPYTVCFENARKARGGKMVNPNDPQENPDLFHDPSLLAPVPTHTPPSKSRNRSQEQIGRRAVRPDPELRISREDGKSKPLGNSPAIGGQKTAADQSNYGGRGEQRGGRSTRTSTAGSEQSFERSPMHYQARVTGRAGGGSPANWEGRNHDASHGTSGRSRLRAATKGEETPDKGAAVPIFGKWNEDDPQSAENFTDVFNKVREERKAGNGTAVSGAPKRPAYGQRVQHSDEPKKCCFPWW